MARARNIKPGFFTNEHVVGLGLAARLLYIGLWQLADREGRLEDRPKRIKMEIFPADPFDVDALLADIEREGLIRRYSVDGHQVIWIPGFSEHQNPHPNEKRSELPAYPGDDIAKNTDDAQPLHNDAQPLHDDVPPYHERSGHDTSDLAESLNTESGILNPESHARERAKPEPDAEAEPEPASSPDAEVGSGTDDDSRADDRGVGASGDTPKSRKSTTIASRFDAFWAAYPNKTGKGAARKAWGRIRPDPALTERMMAWVEDAKNSAKWREDGGKYIPNPATWLNQTRWEDDVPPPAREPTPFPVRTGGRHDPDQQIERPDLMGQDRLDWERERYAARQRGEQEARHANS